MMARKWYKVGLVLPNLYFMLSLPFLRARPPSGGLTTWCKEAALAGYASAQNNLAGMYAEGDGSELQEGERMVGEGSSAGHRRGIGEFG